MDNNNETLRSQRLPKTPERKLKDLIKLRDEINVAIGDIRREIGQKPGMPAKGVANA